MLQVPALLDEQGTTAGAALHYLQALLVSPMLVRTKFASEELCESLFLSRTDSDRREIGGIRRLRSVSSTGSAWGNLAESTRQMVRRYKHWLMYYRVMLHGKTTQLQNECNDILSPSGFNQHILAEYLAPEVACKHGIDNLNIHQLGILATFDKVRPLDHQEDVTKSIMAYETPASIKIMKIEFVDVLDESQSDTHYFEDEYSEGSMEDSTGVFDIARIDSDGRKQARYDQFDLLFSSAYLYRKIDPRNGISDQRVRSSPVSSFPRIQQIDCSELSRNPGKIMHSKSGKDYALEITSIYRILNNKQGVKYTMLKDMILEQLLIAVSTSKEETVIRASVSVLTTIISANISVIDDIKKKGLRLSDLARALKCNVLESTTLIYLIKPSAAEIKTLELLPTLVDVICTSESSRCRPSKPLTLIPPAASLMIIEVLVTAFDNATNNTHLATINSPSVLSRFVDVARDHSLEEHISFWLQFLSSAISLLQQIQKGGISIMNVLVVCLRCFRADYRILAANLLVQLDILKYVPRGSYAGPFSVDSNGGKYFAVIVVVHSVKYWWNLFLDRGIAYSSMAGEKGWFNVVESSEHDKELRLVGSKPAGSVTKSSCSKIARSITEFGKPAFVALQMGLKSQIKRGLLERPSRPSPGSVAKFPNVQTALDIRHVRSYLVKYGTSKGNQPTLVWDVKEHRDSVTCFALFEPGETLLSGSADKTIRKTRNILAMEVVEDFIYLNCSSSANSLQIWRRGTQQKVGRVSAGSKITSLITANDMVLCGTESGFIKAWIPL
ncbi:hypothetical protein F3Y22_tig00112159pilonHSYRG00347 [Hibiscus syriacus]|uniref:Putative E3 ubiquitin-protein ligase LIN ARM repeats domain-containing protein n=1 Tax=Hibiscus syriacus TaxID=106335 RepID=A0A6A2X5C8_HIBSY|nr:hypothetical protein F3Y22_tig00112159pilonHSYRG00347 [Hibiscus syriacus]